jgi:hypothetical protein
MSSYTLASTAIDVIFYVLLTDNLYYSLIFDWWHTIICSSTTRFYIDEIISILSSDQPGAYVFPLILGLSSHKLTCLGDRLHDRTATHWCVTSIYHLHHSPIITLHHLHSSWFISSHLGFIFSWDTGEDSLNGYWWSWLTTSHLCIYISHIM